MDGQLILRVPVFLLFLCTVCALIFFEMTQEQVTAIQSLNCCFLFFVIGQKGVFFVRKDV